MPKFFCDYCDVYLTHDSMSVRKAHNTGKNHLRNVTDYYQQIGHDRAQSVIDSITSSYAAEGQQGPLQFNPGAPGPGSMGGPGGGGPPPFGMGGSGMPFPGGPPPGGFPPPNMGRGMGIPPFNQSQSPSGPMPGGMPPDFRNFPPPNFPPPGGMPGGPGGGPSPGGQSGFAPPGFGPPGQDQR